MARLFKFYSQFRNKYQVERVPLHRVPADGLYSRHKKAFDALANICSGYGVDPHRYMKFFIRGLVKFEKDIDRDLVSKRSFSAYVDSLAAVEKRLKVYAWFEKSAKNLAEFCAGRGYPTAKEGFAALVRERRLAPWLVSGKMSKYFLCAMPGFRKLAKRLDRLTRQDMADLESRFDIYNTEVNEASLYVRNRKASPFTLADEFLAAVPCRDKRDSGLFDPSL